jgi:hypothetical protein
MAQSTPPAKPILSYPNKVISFLCLQVTQQLAVLQRIKAVLPNNLANHVLHCVINDKKLMVYTDSAAWASQLRFYGQAMLAVVEPVALVPVNALRVKVISLPVTTGTDNKNTTVIPTQAVADEIRNHSSTITDLQLKKALAKLSSTLTRLQSQKIPD